MSDHPGGDPLAALRDPTGPVDPDPAFATALRARLEQALLNPTEDTAMTTATTTGTTSAGASHAGPDPAAARLHTLTPYLAVTDASAAVAFYVTAFGAARRGEPITMPDGRIGHAEVLLGDSVLMLAEEFPEMGLIAPVTRGGVSQSLRLEVADPDAVVAAALAAGGTLERPVTDSPYGRGGVLLDPSGHRWMVSREAPAARPGDVVYASMWRPDVAAAARFYAAVLGWRIQGAAPDPGRHAVGLSLPVGFWGAPGHPTTLLCFSVPDVDAAVALVRAAGGTADEPRDTRAGRRVNCVDDQGLRFALSDHGTPPDPTEPGGLGYAELRVPDATAARAFYSTVLGWRFVPGTRPGYWHMTGGDGMTRPVMGLSGGHGEPVVVPTFTVPDLTATAAAVRAAGGTVDEPAAGHDPVLVGTDDQGGLVAFQQPR